MSSAGWPVVLRDDEVVLRPLRVRDGAAWREVRAANTAWLRPWEATDPAGSPPVRTFPGLVWELSRQGRSGTAMPFALEVQGAFAGQVTVGGITWGAMRSAHVGYWIDGRLAGRGSVPRAVALAVDHCLRLGLHRLEVNIRPENAASLRVVEKLGFRDEGLRERFLHIDGAWRDHRTFALTREELPDGLLARYRATRPPDPPPPPAPPALSAGSASQGAPVAHFPRRVRGAGVVAVRSRRRAGGGRKRRSRACATRVTRETRATWFTSAS